jgi:hypothetical protein
VPQAAKVALYKQVPTGLHIDRRSIRFVGDIHSYDSTRRKRVLEAAAGRLGTTLSTNLKNDGIGKVILITNPHESILRRAGVEVNDQSLQMMESSEIFAVRQELARNGIVMEN